MGAESDALRRARARRAGGVMQDFDGGRLSLARRLRRLTRTSLAGSADVSAAAITQLSGTRAGQRPLLLRNSL